MRADRSIVYVPRVGSVVIDHTMSSAPKRATPCKKEMPYRKQTLSRREKPRRKQMRERPPICRRRRTGLTPGKKHPIHQDRRN